MENDEKKENVALDEEQLEKVSGGGIGINYLDNCHYDPPHFVKSTDPDFWSHNQCSRCIYNAHRLWKDSVCTYPDIPSDNK